MNYEYISRSSINWLKSVSLLVLTRTLNANLIKDGEKILATYTA